MQAIKAIYDGVNFTPQQPIPVDEKYEVIITFIKPFIQENTEGGQVKKHPFSEMRGILKGKVWMADDFDEPLDEMKEYM
jgi:hypothetical protein